MASGWFSVQADWTTLFLLIIAWYMLLRHWERTGKLDDWNATKLFGVILMLRTNSGKKTLEVVSKPRRFWRAYGEVSLWVCWLAMAIVAILLLIALITAIISDTKADPPSASELVAIPGLNPMIPLGWGAMAFIICLVIHEFGHGIQARAHGMRVRNFGLLMLGPLPLGAFAEPEHAEIVGSPRRERQRMFAAGPATNIFAAFFLMILLGQVAGQFAAASPGVHSSQIIKDSGADEGGLAAWDVIIAIDGENIADTDDFTRVMDGLSAGDEVEIEVIRHVGGIRETLMVNLTDKHAYYLELGWDEESLEAIGVEPGDAFLGVQGLAGGTAGVDRLAGWAHPDFETNAVGYVVVAPLHTLNLLVTPFQLQGTSIHPAQEEMLAAGDGWLAGLVGLDGLLFIVNLLFWLIWVNILLGFTNLIPMVPFDGGHLFRDMVHGTMSGLRKLGRKTGLYNIHPLWVEHVTRRASSLSSLMLLLVLVFLMFAPYL